MGLRGGKIGQDKGEYEKGFKTIGTFNTVEQFWTCYSHITRADALPNLDLHMFKDGIKPMWEDAANKIGGKAMVRVHKTLAARCWEAVLLAIEKIRSKIRVLMDLPEHVQVDYSPHDGKAVKTDGWRGANSPRMRGFEAVASRGSPRSRGDRPFYMRGNNQFVGGSGAGMGDFGMQQPQQQQRSYTWGTRSWGRNQT